MRVYSAVRPTKRIWSFRFGGGGIPGGVLCRLQHGDAEWTQIARCHAFIYLIMLIASISVSLTAQ